MCCSTRRNRIRLPSSMSGLPALRCFILFAADLIILVYRPSVEKPPEQMGQGFTHIYRFKLAWMDEFVLEPRIFCGMKGFHQPVNHVPHPRDAATAGMIGQPNIEGSVELNLKRYHFATQRTGVGGQYADTGAVRDGPVVGAADVCLHHQQVTRGISREKTLKGLLGG